MAEWVRTVVCMALACVGHRGGHENERREGQLAAARNLIPPDARLLRDPQRPQRLLKHSGEPLHISARLQS